MTATGTLMPLEVRMMSIRRLQDFRRAHAQRLRFGFAVAGLCAATHRARRQPGTPRTGERVSAGIWQAARATPRNRRHHCRGGHALGAFPFHKAILRLAKRAVVAAGDRHQLLMRAAFHNAVILHHQNPVGMPDGGQAMRNHKAGTVL